VEDFPDLGSVEGLPLHEGSADALQGVAVGGEDGPGLVVSSGDELADLLVDEGGYLVGVVLVADLVLAE